MGNYYTGTLRFVLPSTCDSDLINDLHILTKNSMSFLQDEEFNHMVFRELSESFKTSNWFNNTSFGYIDYNIWKLYDDAKRKIIGYYFEANIHTKIYHPSTPIANDIVNYLRPHMGIDLLYEFGYDEDFLIGTIEDEDYDYKKSYYLKECYLQNKQDERKHICNGCEQHNPDYLCDNWDICKRAYDLGEAARKINAVLEGEF